MRQEVIDTVGQADEDRATVHALIVTERFYGAVFFSQQVAEKALKAVYLHQRKELPYSHNLVTLARGAEAHTVLAGAA